jgi:starvation-inducible DNA-binding protein
LSAGSFHFALLSQGDETLPAHPHPTRYAVIRHGNPSKEYLMALSRNRSVSMSSHTSQESKASKANVADGFSSEQVKNLSSVLNALAADVFALYLKTKNFHWHMSGPHFRDYHLLLDEQATQIFDITDAIAERVRKVGGTTIRSIGHIAKLQRITDNDQEFVPARDMLLELHADNRALVESLRAAHEVASRANDYATTSLIEVWIDEAERRAWFLFEATR